MPEKTKQNLRYLFKGLRWCATAWFDALIARDNKRAWAAIGMAKENFDRIQK